ncbi:MAG: VCBS repeat-containing protein [Verrucomicrobia bacterium]|nr:VCBS repeat-containing protein [Verrucomicrobiota bacterium]
MDILTGSISGKVHFYRKKPNGTYAAGETFKISMLRPLTVGSSSAITVSDWDHDGDLDLIIGNGEGAVYWAVNEGTRAKPVWGQPRRLKAGGQFLVADGGAAAPCVADWDGDGLPDLLLGSSSGKVIWCRNQGEKAKPELAAPEVLVTAFPRNLTREKQWFEQPRRSAHDARICVADWNGDDRPDLLVGDYSLEGQRGNHKLHGWVWVYLRREASGTATDAANSNPPAAN